MKRPERTVIFAGLGFCVIWGGLFYYFAQIYPDEWHLMVRFGLGVPLLLMYYVMDIPEIARDLVESIRNETLKDSLKIVADLTFFRHMLAFLVFVVLIVLMKVISMF